jgi:hypothetical protein
MSGEISGDECDDDSQTSTGLTTFVTINEENVGTD